MSIELYKQPSESRLYHFVYSSLLATGETLDAIQSIVSVNLGKVSGSSNLTLLSQSYSADTAQIRISGGTAGESYKLTAVVITDLANILEIDGILHVKEL